ncbi:hypothetical protein GCM10011608_09210 [Micromonospora sonchi]|uniref:Uncharacterized protein n=1 Tax=Micromonospora sonchi TaxID=1763543 RepID=A0A917TMQ8_9ACTN|nr:hypothetical protein [Micromonospora sonchi]GGM26581.1 hypothetical protein GCM10011608_09210 [Micromonospora sonchi]
MTARVGLAVGGGAFAVSVAFALADVWLAAAALQMVPAYVAGRWDRRRDRNAELVSLAAELRRAEARIAALEDHIDEQYDRRGAGRWLDESRFVPDDRDWPELNRKPTPADVASPRPFSTA